MTQQKIYRDVWKISQVRKIISGYKKGDYGDDELIAARAALNNIIAVAKEDE